MTLTALSIRTGILAMLSVLGNGPLPVARASYDPDDKQAVRDHWTKSGRYLVGFADDNAPYQVRQTSEGSVWLLNYARKARGSETAKVIPGQAPVATNSRQTIWNDWIEAKYALDEYQAAKESSLKNRGLGANQNFDAKSPKDPGPCPADLVKLAGQPPVFVLPALVKSHTVSFDDLTVAYQDNVKVRRKYAYYRFGEGVMDVGERMSQTGIDKVKPLFAKAGVDESKLRVMAAVSLLEGGFDSINTYDTGYVSVGFIQFACLSRGAGSLGQVLKTMKTADPDAFDQDFRSFGIDVTPQGELVALNLSTLEEATGATAAMTIIGDRRLTAVFQRAGRLSEPFRLAQIKTALDLYYPAEDAIQVRLGGKTLTGKVSDIVKTEAGLATLMDRKVNTGSLGDLNRVVAGLMVSYDLKDLKEVADLEYELIQAMVYRDNYLEAENLSKPKPSARTASRG